jgi:hypothetical protein
MNGIAVQKRPTVNMIYHRLAILKNKLVIGKIK